MKKTLSLLLTLALVFCLCACAESEVQPSGGEEVPNEQTQQTGTPPEETPEQPDENEQPSQENETPPSEAPKEETPLPQQSASHTHKYEAVTTSATCQAQGFTTYTCSCGHSYTDDHVDGTHDFTDGKCSRCGKGNVEEMYTALKAWVLDNGTVNGDYVTYWSSADEYGGYSEDSFDLTYWSGSGNVVFCLNSKVDDTYAVSFFVYIPEQHTGKYEYATSYYLRATGEHVYYATGVIEGDSFTKNSPLTADEYKGPAEGENDFKELSRVGVCAALDCLKEFLEKENTGYTLSEIGFTAFS